jgi:hypothetical protein
VCPTAQEKPDQAPSFEPCIRIAKVSGPGASAPDAVTITTVTIKSIKFTCYESLRYLDLASAKVMMYSVDDISL